MVNQQYKLPPGSLAAVLLFWGWSTQWWPVAIPIALLLEAAPLIHWRWALGDREFARVIDLTLVIWVGAVIILFLRYLNHPPLAVQLYTLATWLPLLFFPPFVIQRYSTADAFRLGQLIFSLRNSQDPLAKILIKFDFLYFFTCLFAASIPKNPYFLIWAGGCLLWIIFALRPQRHARQVTLLLIFSASLAALPVSRGLHRLQSLLEDAIGEWFLRGQIIFDPYRYTTSFGEIGELKLSEQIVVRLIPEMGARGPWLLRLGGYNHYFDGVWQAKGVRFERVDPESDGRSWKISSQAQTTENIHKLMISMELHRGAGMLPVPAGTVRLNQLPVGDLQVSSFGALKARDGPGLVNYETIYSSNNNELNLSERDLKPNEEDLILPPQERPILQKIVIDQGLKQTNELASAARIKNFLLRDFRYSLDLTAPAWGHTALQDFLTQTHSGHCEYFASAAALLLRAVGIPARYAVGFSVFEYSAWEKSYIARRSHAHAWALVWLQGAWHDFDATPPDWGAWEAERAPWWRKIVDIRDWLINLWDRWRWRENTDESDYTNWMWGVLIMLVIILFWRLLRRQRVKRPKEALQPEKINWPGAESPFYRIVEHLTHQAGPRPPGESLIAWLQRIGMGEDLELRTMLAWHQRWRFDPIGLSAVEQKRLAAATIGWLARVKV